MEATAKAAATSVPEGSPSTQPDPLWRNGLTYVGGILAAVALLFILAFLFFDLASPTHNPYVGLFTYLVFPGVLLVGLLMFVFGFLVTRRRHRRQFGSLSAYQYYPRLDLNDPVHRRALATTGAMAAVTIPVIGLLSYEGYHYTDSNQFCGAVCHTVMEPQYTTFQQSPHAHVGCAACHIGPGASWYVKSKLSGLRQVLAVALDTFPRPIPPAIQELRPATETCQQCHWPAKFYGDQLVTINHFAPDEKNTHTQIRMLLKTGGSDPSTGPPSGIHWHMALGFTVEYVATDEHLQEIPWVQTTDHATGRSTVYRSDGRPAAEPPPAGIRRTVDCMDCHNRPTHIVRSPDSASDVALYVNPRLQTLPFAKREMVRAMIQPYSTKAEATSAVRDSIERFYQDQHPAVWRERKTDVERLAQVATDIYGTNNFPEMNVSWRTYPDNIGHKIHPGCFRCHDGRHVDAAGRPLSHECGACHEFLLPVPGDGDTRSVVQTGGFLHPVPLEGIHAALRCDQCHTGGAAPVATCKGCHSEIVEFRGGRLPGWSGPALPADAMAEAVDCDGCHDLSKPRSIAAVDEKCMECHEDDTDRFEGMLAGWKNEVELLLRKTPESAEGRPSPWLEALRRAGPMHNMEATRAMLRTLRPSASASSAAGNDSTHPATKAKGPAQP